MTREAIEARVQELGPWFHRMDLGGVDTAPDHFLGDYPNVKYKKIAPILPEDLTGKSVLDIGCNAGFYAMELKRRGADRVVGTDSDPISWLTLRNACSTDMPDSTQISRRSSALG